MAREPAALVAALAATGAEVSSADDARLVHEHDGSTLHGSRPVAVAWPADTRQVAALVRACVRAGVPFVARGAGTGLSGGAMALGGGVVIALNRLDRVLAVDAPNRRAVVQPGVANAEVSRAAAPHGLRFAPDPSSQAVCSIGGNVAHNSGGPHTLKHGVTVNHVLGLQLVLPDGSVERVGGPGRPGYDLLALLCGSEGTLGLVTEVTLRLVPRPAAVRTLLAAFSSPDEASRAVSAIVAAGVLPSAMELMDAVVVEALRAAFGFTFPPGAGALLLLEADGPDEEADAQAQALEAQCRAQGALSVRLAASEAERAEVWRARKRAFGALGRITRNYCTQDGVIPRTRLPEMLARVADIGARHRLRIANVFHAGDGNLHPCILFDDRDADERARVGVAGREILRACLELGGSLSGEHGVGVEKREAMAGLFDAPSLAAMRRLRDAFDPAGLCNPGKILPMGGACHETSPRRRQIPA
jgi:glycolate oxidase